MKNMTMLGLAVLLAVAVSMNGFAADDTKMPAGVMMERTSTGPVLADSGQMTLYTFDKDTTPGKSACNGPCAQNWPPLTATSDANSMGDWTVVSRDDGSKQWAYKGKPLYRWVKDQKPGDATGEGFNNVWHVAKP